MQVVCSDVWNVNENWYITMSFFHTFLSPTPYSFPLSTFCILGLFSVHLTCLLRALLPALTVLPFFALTALSNCKSIRMFWEWFGIFFFLTTGLEIAWGGMFRAKFLWHWRLNSRLPCKNFKDTLLGHKLCLALTKPEKYLWAWGRFCSLYTTLVEMWCMVSWNVCLLWDLAGYLPGSFTTGELDSSSA